MTLAVAVSPKRRPRPFSLASTKPPIPLEREDQVAYFRWLYYECPKYHGERVWHSAFCIPNGGYKLLSGKGSLGQQGLKRGVPDIQIVIPVEPHHGMFLELKRQGARPPNAEQLAWHARLTQAGYFVALCFGLSIAKAMTLDYLKL